MRERIGRMLGSIALTSGLMKTASTCRSRGSATTAPADVGTRTDIYAKGAAMAKVPLSKNEGRRATTVYGVEWDSSRYAEYASGFKIKA